ncbi:MAG: Peroxisome biosynthesis protein pex1 [Bathelium mastoideum]|nr:MAG: Peroxisome biosynthesis protein pex1 [Bathelium mastoideum]
MAALPKRGTSLPAEVNLVQQLKNCLVNLPPSLVAILINANTLAQNVVVELSYRQPAPAATGNNTASRQTSVFLGWTGMQTKQKPASVVGKDGLAGSRGTTREQNINVVELDATFARLLGISDGQKVNVSLHVDPPEAHTVNIEPMTASDWEIIELHARFLEVNFLSQIRALPNPSSSGQPGHPLTLHLSPTSTANVLVTSLSPSPPSVSPFAKISSDAEVIVAPKTRQKAVRSSTRESRSVGSVGRKSTGGKSGASTVRHASTRADAQPKEPLFFRGLDRATVEECFDGESEESKNEGLKIWVDSDALFTKPLRGVNWVVVSIVNPSGLQEPREMQNNAESNQELEPVLKIVARLNAWEDAPDNRHAALSTQLCACLRSRGLVGGLVRIEAAPTQVHKLPATSSSETRDHSPRKLKIFPFSSTSSSKGSGGLQFGGESNAEKEEATRRLGALFVGTADSNGLLKGPITDGMVLPPIDAASEGIIWQGGLLRFDPASAPSKSGRTKPTSWFLGSEKKLGLELQPAIPKPSSLVEDTASGEPLPQHPPELVGVDKTFKEVTENLTHLSSVMLTGGLGSGKTSLSQLIGCDLRNELLYHTTYVPCRTLFTEESRVSTIKETLNRVFARASWGARLGGRSVVILDDIDRLCPTETELQVGGNNERSRQVSEVLCAVARQYCSSDSPVVLLATAQSKEAVNNVIIGGHAVRDIVNLMAPNKETRRQMLEALVHQFSNIQNSALANGTSPQARHSEEGAAWMDGHSTGSRPGSAEGKEGFLVSPQIDFLDVSGQTDGYMPGDLSLLISRARSEALIRAISQSTEEKVELSSEDFTSALRGFTPASLRNVSLQTSSTSFSSIGGLKYTRQILLETLQYPTTYAPIFANCPLRLRSGLLLYGYPGCGKTLLASAVAGECGLNFISVKGPEILNKYIGASEKSVRDLFERAQAARPCILFFDEFDSVAPKRGHDSTGVTDRVVNQLLTQMDGAEGLSGVYVLAATSRPDLIDPALLRPGRLDKSLLCDMPTLEDRVDILRAVFGKLKVDAAVLSDGDTGHNLLEVAKRTEGYSGADLQAVIYNAHLEAIHDILGVEANSPTDYSSKLPSREQKSNKRPHRTTKTPDFVHFLFGDDLSLPGTNGVDGAAPNKELTERAKITDQLATLQLQRRRQKQLARASRHFGQAVSAHDEDAEDGEHEDQEKEPVISWHHLESSLDSTRPSIGSEERMRLARIYREFVVGRNGEMPSGQGGYEIGGRTSLM